MENAMQCSALIDRIVRCIFPRRHAVNEQLELQSALPPLPSFPWWRVSMADRGGYDDDDYDNKRRRLFTTDPPPRSIWSHLQLHSQSSVRPSVSQDSVERPIIMPLSAVTTTSTATAAATVARPVSAVAMAKNGVCVDIWVRSQVHRRRRPCRAPVAPTPPVATDAAENTCW